MDQEAAGTGSGATVVPPYMPFKTFTNLLVRMAEQGVPRRIDAGYLNSMSGGTRAQLMGGLKWFGLIDAEDHPQPGLKALVEARDSRPQAVAALFKDKYDWALALGNDRATQDELDAAFRDRGVTGSTMRKASAFFLQGAQYAGLPVSPFFKKAREAPVGRRRRPAGPKADRGTVTKEDQKPPKPTDEKPRVDESWQERIEPVVLEWLKRIPAKGTPWPKADRNTWNAVLMAMLDGIHAKEDAGK